MSRCRNYCFTSYNFDAPFTSWTKDEHPECVRALVFQTEQCPDTGRRHIQGYVEFTTAKTIAAAKGCLGDVSCHFERRKGTASQAADYCRKTDSRVAGVNCDFGDFGGDQGKRTDLTAAISTLRDSGLAGVAELHAEVYVKYSRGLHSLAFEYARAAPESPCVRVILLHGPPGVGKSRTARFLSGQSLFVVDEVVNGHVWFDGYRGERFLLIDDVYGTIKYTHMLRLLDRYRIRLSIKGGHTYSNWHTIFITANTEILNWYPDVFKGDANCSAYKALRRRFTKVLSLPECLPDSYFTDKKILLDKLCIDLS